MSRLLLDTHALLWWEVGQLPKAVIKRIQAADEVFVSSATLWEIAIKQTLGKLDVTRPLSSLVDDNGFAALPIDVSHVEALASLPAHHRDPFDRMLVAQALTERLTLVTKDPLVLRYAATCVWS